VVNEALPETETSAIDSYRLSLLAFVEPGDFSLGFCGLCESMQRDTGLPEANGAPCLLPIETAARSAHDLLFRRCPAGVGADPRSVQGVG